MNNCIKIFSFVVSSMVSFSILGFSIYKLTTELKDNEQTIYYSLLTSLLTLWTPSPINLLNTKKIKIKQIEETQKV